MLEPGCPRAGGAGCPGSNDVGCREHRAWNLEAQSKRKHRQRKPAEAVNSSYIAAHLQDIFQKLAPGER